MKSFIVVAAVFSAVAAHGQDATGDRITVPFSDPSRPKTVKANVINGSITVRGYDGKDVLIEGRSHGSDGRRNIPKKAEGMHRIDTGAFGLTAEEQDNVVRISATPSHNVNLVIQVPYSTSLQLRSQNDGSINVEHVEGEIDADNLNGNVKLINVSGVVIAHSLNGEVQVT